MEKHRIDPGLMKNNAFPTGVCTVTLDNDKIPVYNIHKNTAYDNIEITEEDIKKIKEAKADVFYFNTLIQRNAASRRSLLKILENCHFENIFCDINIRKDCFDTESLRLCMEKATIVKISEEEAHFLHDTKVLKKSSDLFLINVAKQFPNLKLILYTKGKDGSEVLDTASGKIYSSGKPEPVTVVSTVGAGDCFGASFLSSYLKNKDIPLAIDEATKRSNIVVSSYEAVPFSF